MRPCVVIFIFVVVPMDERILVNQTLTNELFRCGYSQFSIPPRPVCQDYRRKAPVVANILKVEVASEPSAGQEENAGLPQASINAAVLLVSLLDMPAGQAILNLAIRLLVLLNDNRANPIVCAYLRSDGASDACSNNGDEVIWFGFHVVLKGALVRFR